jgi:hypothetical protein
MKGQRLLLLLLGALFVAPFASGQATVSRKKVVFDQDTDGIIGGNNDPLVMLLQSPNVEVLGVTVATGNGWLKQETADVLKLLEVIDRPDVPVYMGSEFPLVQSKETPVLLTRLYGGSRTDPFLGAYGEYSAGPDVVVPPPGGFAKTKPQPGHAALFIIKSIRDNPHERRCTAGARSRMLRLRSASIPASCRLRKKSHSWGLVRNFNRRPSTSYTIRKRRKSSCTRPGQS